MTTYPTIPTLAPQADDETVREYGLRAFRFLLAENLCAAVLDTADLEQAIAASMLLLPTPDLAPVVRARYHAIRFDILSTLDRRQRAARQLEKAAAAAAKPNVDGGKPAPLRRPVPVIPPASVARRF